VAERTQALRDEIEERRRAEELLRVASKELARSNEELEKFAYIASHDLQEPLRKIQAFGDRLSAKYRGALDDTAQEYIERMMSSATRMRQLINDLLSFSRISTKGIAFEPVNLAVVVREVLSDLEVRMSQTEANVEVGELPTLDGDPLQMRQLFQNLLGNALKFHRPGEPPRIRISSEPTSRPMPDGTMRQWHKITIADDGIGFDEKYVERIFEVFQRLHGRNEYEGTGVGLAICRKIVERHSGTITATSAKGEGSTFTVLLPAGQPQAEFIPYADPE
jgi:light-regulated signal transduction histidine kinase (bacteriophytochrome)